MKLGIMQPYFFPYIGYFELIYLTDKWVVFDVVQYKSKSWMNRNRILHPKEGWQYFGVPVRKASRGTLIRDIEIENKNKAFNRILGQLNHYRKSAPHYRQVIDIVEKTFSNTKSTSLSELNVSSLWSVCDYLGIKFEWSVCSKMNLELDNIEHPGQWALKIARQLNAAEYINPLGGRGIFKKEEWDTACIDLSFCELPNCTYDCSPFTFVENLSIIDVLMWNDPMKTLQLIRRSF